MPVSGWNVVDVVTGALGILATIIPVLAVWTCAGMPKKRLPGLEAILEKTQDLFIKAQNEELITDQKELNCIRNDLACAKAYVDELRAQVYSAKSFPQNLRNWWKGLHGKISSLQEALNDFRIDLAQRSSDAGKIQISRNLDSAFARRVGNMGFILPSPPDSPSLSSTSSSTASPAPEEHSKNLASPGATPVLPSTNGIEDSVTVPVGDTPHSPHTIDRHPTPDRRPTHHLMTSDAHLQSFRWDTNHCKPKAGARDATLLHTERRLHAPGYTRKISRYRFVRRARPAVVHIYRYVFYGAHPSSGDGTPPSTLYDPESLLPRGVRYGDDANADDS